MYSGTYTGEAPPENNLLGKVVGVTWVRAKTWANAWVAEDDIGRFYLPEIISRGCVVKETEGAIFIAQSEGEDEYSNLIGIPRGCISDIRELDE